MNMERQDISPAVYHVLQDSQPTFASVERSFSMLKTKLLRKPEISRSRMSDIA